MTTRGQPQRFTTTQTAPASGARLAGELWTNAPDLQIGFIDASKNPQKLVAVRYFSATANYAVNDFVVNGGGFYAAKVSITAAAFNPAQWTLIGSVTDPGGPYLPVAGGTLIGPLVLQADPSANLGAATKQYVDNRVVTGGAIYLPLAGGTMSGLLTLSGSPSNANHAATKAYVDGVGVGVFLPLAGGALTGPLVLPEDPTLPLEASTKSYVDSKLIAQGENRLINGDMRIDARNGGASGSTIGYAIDRWAYNATQSDKGTWQRTTLPPGTFTYVQFGYCLTFTAVPGYAVTSTDTFSFMQPVEAEMCGDLVWGTPNAQPAVLSFWVASTLTGQFGGSIRNAPTPSNRSFTFTYNIIAASTWQFITIPIPADIAGTWVMQGSAAALIVHFDLGSGATWQAPAGGWLNANAITAPGCVSTVAVSGARFNVTAVKFELGTTPTPYPHQSPARNALDCQRYFSLGQVSAAGYCAASGQPVLGMINFPNTMRVAPFVGITPVGAINVGSGLLGPINSQGVYVNHGSLAAGVCSFTDNWTASAEL